MPMPFRCRVSGVHAALVSSCGGAAHAPSSTNTSKLHVVHRGARALPRRPVAVAGTVSQPAAVGSPGPEDDAELGDLGGCEGPLHVAFALEPPQLQTLAATQCGIIFKLHFPSRPGQEVVVTGSDPSLGSWDPQQGLKLQWSEGHTWSHEEPVQLPAGQQLQYKYVVLSNQRPQQLWSSGENLSLDVPGTGGCWTLQDAWQLPSNHVMQEGMAPEACLVAASAAASMEAGGAEVAPAAGCEAAASCEHLVGSQYPIPIKYKCFLCGQCMQPHLHERSCPRGFSDEDVERIFEETVSGHAHGERRERSVVVTSSEE